MNPSRTAWQKLTERVLSIAEIRNTDRVAMEKYHVHSLVLMENAALGCVHWLTSRFREPQAALILCGRGNNGGDGLAIARHLRALGWFCRVVVLGPIECISADARANLDILLAAGGRDVVIWDRVNSPSLQDWLESSTIIVDAMLGTGAIGDPKPPLNDWIRGANAMRAFRVAIDIPTGWDAETGVSGDPTFQAHATLTFLAKKPAMVLAHASECLGELAILPIGIPLEQIEELLID